METIHLQINSKVYDHVMWLLKQFNSNDVQIVSDEFLKTKAEVNETLRRANNGEMKFFSMEEAEKGADDILAKYEN